MPKPLSPSRFPLLGRAHDAVQAFLRLMSFYGVPIAIGIFSVIALLFWDSQYVSSGERPVMLRVVAESGTALNPRAALGRLDAITPVTTYDTRLSQAPVWFSLNSRSNGSDQPVIEFPSRHALAIACWDADTLQALGSSSRSHSEGALAPVKAGFALRLAQHQERVLCRASFAGPARLTALQWPAAQLAQSEIQFHRKSGLLDGGMVVLALFVFITALINRQRLYVLFAGWLVINLRVGALSGGWDTQWLGQIVPPEWLLLTRSVSIALVSITTLTLYLTLFRDEIAKTRYMTPLRVVEWLCLPLLVASVVLPYNTFLPLMWPIVGGGLTLMTLGLFTIMFQSSNRVAIWFTASFMVTFVSGLSELVAAALGIRELMGLVNSVTAALTSSLLAALAVAEQMRIETMQRIAAQAELEHTYEAMPVGLFTLDGQGGFLSANPAMHIMLNAEVLPGRARFKDYFPERVWAQLDELVHQHAAAELAIQNHDGSRHFLVRATLARGKIEGVLQDTTEQTKATQQLEFLANHDPLTKVYNRRGIEVAFEEATAAAGSEPVALAYLDLDRFKLINDMFGHTAGDEVLQQVCERINSVLSGGRHIGRVGGDEFVMVMPDTTVALATLICRGVIDRIGNTPFRVADKAFHVRGSIGLIEITPGMPIKDAISTADRACREAKAGNDGLVTYERDAAAFHEREAELTLLAQLSGTEATARMFIEMQPIMSLTAPHESLNFEVLLRMRETDGRVTAAAPIVAAAEKSGRASVIDRWVLSTTLGWIEKNAQLLSSTQFVCMNLSGASLNDERFVQDTIDMLKRHVHVASRLCMEITESVALHDLDNTRRFIDQVRNFGVKIALDDFGAGYTSFSYLKELPADVLKIDGNFIVNINEHPANVAIVEAIVSLAVNLGMKTIAEWAEDTATVRTLADIGVDYVQGWAVARSMSPEQLLSGSSAAAFIQTEDLVQLVRTFGSPTTGMTLGVAGGVRVHGLH